MDFAIWPWFERFKAAEKLYKVTFVSEQTFPKLSAWMKTMKRLEAVKKVALNEKLHMEYYQLKLTDPTSLELPDIGLDE